MADLKTSMAIAVRDAISTVAKRNEKNKNKKQTKNQKTSQNNNNNNKAKSGFNMIRIHELRENCINIAEIAGWNPVQIQLSFQASIYIAAVQAAYISTIFVSLRR